MAAMPPDPVTAVREASVGTCEFYKQLRAGGWPILAAACYVAATIRLNSQDQDAD